MCRRTATTAASRAPILPMRTGLPCRLSWPLSPYARQSASWGAPWPPRWSSAPEGSCRRGRRLARAARHPGACHQLTRAGSSRQPIPVTGKPPKLHRGVVPAGRCRAHGRCAAGTFAGKGLSSPTLLNRPGSQGKFAQVTASRGPSVGLRHTRGQGGVAEGLALAAAIPGGHQRRELACGRWMRVPARSLFPKAAPRPKLHFVQAGTRFAMLWSLRSRPVSRGRSSSRDRSGRCTSSRCALWRRKRPA